MRGRRWAWVGVAVIAVVVLGAALVVRSDDRPRREGSPATEGSGEQLHRAPAGTDLRDGLLVPEGTWLAGVVFDDPGEATPGGPALDGWTAVLGIDGDPLQVWDHLAEQTATSDALPAIDGSNAACYWSAADRYSQPFSRPPAGDVAGVDCSGTSWRAFVTGEGTVVRTLTVTLEIRSGVAGHVEVEVVNAYRDLTRRPPAPPPAADHRTADLAGRSLAIAPPPSTTVAVGDVFGGGANCFERGGDDDFSVPVGAEVVLVGGPSGFATSVLAIRDPERTMAAFLRQVRGSADDDRSDAHLRTARLGSGRTIIQIDAAPGAGGGYCGLQTSADGRYVVIHAASD